MGTADSMVTRALADEGYTEGPRNDNIFGRAYGMNFEPYCDIAVSMWAEWSGNGPAIGRFAYCPYHVKKFKDIGRWHGRNEAAQRGDLVFFDWDGDGVADHVGVVVLDSAPGAVLRTIEANTSPDNGGSQSNGGGVYQRARDRSSVLGFGRPAYDGSPAPSAGAYTVRSGDTLSAIGARLGIPWRDIASASHLSDPNSLTPGQVLTLPSKATTPARPAYPGSVIRRGAKSTNVKAVQDALTRKGFGSYLKPYGSDGTFGAATESAVRAFQRSAGISADGEVGPVTWGRLFA